MRSAFTHAARLTPALPAAILATALTTPVSAQGAPETAELPAPRNGSDIKWFVSGAFEREFGDGEFDAYRTAINVGARTTLSETVGLTMTFGYNWDNYDFDERSDLGNNAWGDIHTASVSAIFSIESSNDWSVFLGPSVSSSVESGVGFDEGVTYGGVVGATYRVNEELRLGAGLSLRSQIDEDEKLSPIVVVDWEITNDLRLTNSGATSAGRNGIELVYKLERDWQLAVGFAFRLKRFALDERGPAPDGAGEDRSTPIWVRLSYQLSDRSSVSIYGGFIAGGRAELDPRGAGHKIDQDYDGLFVGISGSLRF